MGKHGGEDRGDVDTEQVGSAGDTQEAEVAAAFTNVRVVVPRQLVCPGEGGGTH
jgi:hypothetical protein